MRLAAAATLDRVSLLRLGRRLATGGLGWILRSQRAIRSGLLWLVRLVRDVVVCHAAVFHVPAARRTPGDGLVAGVVIVRLGVFEDDVPGMEQTGDIAEAAKSEVNDRVSCANAYFDPY